MVLPEMGFQTGCKNLLNANMGIYISAETEHPEYAVAMIDYQYSDEDGKPYELGC